MMIRVLVVIVAVLEKRVLNLYKEARGNMLFDSISALFNNTGDVVVLFDASGAIVDQVTYGEDPRTDVSIGRSPNGTGSFYLLEGSTEGTQNSGPKAAPTVPPPPTAKPTRYLFRKCRVHQLPAQILLLQHKMLLFPLPNLSQQQFEFLSPLKLRVLLALKIASKSAFPSAVLGAQSQSVTTDKNILPKPTDKVFGQKAASISPLSLVLKAMSIAGCGILMYFKKWKGNK